MRFNAKHPQQLFDALGRDLFQQLLTASGVGADRFRAHYLPVAERLALQLQELPLERATFAEQGGALKFGLLAGLTTLRLCDSVIFAPSATAEQRMAVEPQYRFAAFCASLATVPLIVHHHLSVSIDGKPWSLLSKQPLLWDALGKSASYEVEWKPATAQKPSAALGVLLLSRFFDPGQWAEFAPETVVGLCDAINPAGVQSPAEMALARVVRVGHEKVRQAEQLRAAAAFTPSEPAPIDSMIKALSETPPTAGAPAPAPAAAIPASASANPGAGDATPAERTIPIEVVEWAKALCHTKDVFSKEVVLLPDGKARVSAKALNFGAEAKKMYERIYSAGLVFQKEERGVIVTPALAALFKEQ